MAVLTPAPWQSQPHWFNDDPVGVSTRYEGI